LRGASSLPGVSLPITRAREGAPVHLAAQRYPVVLYQPGYGDIRGTGTGLASDLASRGYIVVTMDDTYEAQVVEFPGGRLATPRPNQSHVGPARLADTRFVLNELVRLRSGANPDALHRRLPTGLSKAIDTSKVGMFGHSLGGAMAAQAMAADSRIYAGIDLDGTILVKKRSLNPKLDEDLARKLGRRPFMLFTRQGHDAQDDPTLAGFWAGLRGWRLFLALRNAQHFTFTDFEEFLSQLLAAGIRPDGITRKLVTGFIGTIQPSQAVAAERAYIAAFFDLHLRGQQSKLLEGPSPQYPQIEFLGR
jgi:dienelactone hydrolase